MNNIYLSIIIPCYNEERNLRLGALENVAHYLKKRKLSYEVIIVDDESTDDSLKLIRKFLKDHKHFRLLESQHSGKAGAVIKGIKQATGGYVVFTDLDQATPIDQLEVVMPWFEKNKDVVIGSRKEQRKGAPFTRIAMAKGFMLLRNLILDLNITDTQCGFKAFTRKAAKDIFSRLQVYKHDQKAAGSTVTAGFDVELLFVAKQLGYHIAEIPVEWHYQETRRVNPIGDSLEGLLGLLKIRWNQLKGLYQNK